MSIALDCPGCRKHFEVDDSLAGKKSRCKQCGEIFQIPVPGRLAAETTVVSKSSAPGSARQAASQWESAAAERARSTPAGRPATTRPPSAAAASGAGATIVINCPSCRKQYELDGALAGRKSRCKNCGEVFSIPAPMGRPVATTAVPKPATPAMPASGPVPSHWESVLEEEPASLKAKRAVAPLETEEDLLPPPRAAYRAPREKRVRSKASGSAVNVGPIIGWFLGLAALSFVGLIIWVAVNELPHAESFRLGRIFGQIFFLGCLGLSLWGYGWIVSIAFQDDAMQGVMCLFVPFYFIYYALTHWEESSGPFALGITGLGFVAVPVVLAIVLPALAAARGRAPSTASTSHRSAKANRALVTHAERILEQDIAAIDGLTNELARVKDLETAQQAGGGVALAGRMLQVSANRSRHVTLRNPEWIVLKHSVGPRLRASLIALKQEFLRVDAIPGFRGKMGKAASDLDKAIDFWTIKPGEETPPGLEDGPAFPIGPSPGPGGGPPPGFPQWGPRNQPGIQDPSLRYQQMLAQHGDRAVTVVFSGVPSNSDPAKGVTTRDVTEALNKRLRELSPGATSWMSLNIDNKSATVLAPVNDVRSLANSIDFGTVMVRGSRIDVELSPGYIAAVPRLPAELSRPQPNPGRRQEDAEIPANADPITKSLLQLKSDDIGRKKEAIERLGRMRPNDRLQEVVSALLPLLGHDDGFLVNDVVETLGVWRSPEAVPKLIERTSDNRFFVRKHAIKVLGKYKDVRAALPVAARLKEDGFEAEEALKEMGSIAEPALIAQLKSADSETRRRACNILKDVGGLETLKAMRSIPPDPDFGVRMAAQDALKQITARVGPQPGTARSGTPSSPPSRRRRNR
jgi:hypothetical protein